MTALHRLLDTRRPFALLALFCALAWLPGFFTVPPFDRDESRFAQATKQMVETGNYVRIMNGAEERNRKPIGINWAQAPFVLAADAAGIARANPIWPYRIPSALGALLAVWATCALGRELAGRRAALLAALMLAGSVIVAVEHEMAKTDAALLGATTLAMGLLARAYLAPAAFRARHAAGFWLAIGAGILLKGPITPMVAALTAGTLCAWDRRAGWLGGLRARWGVPLMLAVVLPWFAAIGVATHGRFFAQAVGGDLGRKLAGGDDAHWGPPGLHLALLPILAFPATVPVLCALPRLWRGLRGREADPATRFLVAWIVPSWLVMEAVPTKLPHYTLPLYPAIFLLAAGWWLDPARRPAPRWLAALSVALFVAIGAALGLGGAALPAALGAPWWWGVPALLAAALVVAPALRRRDVLPALALVPLLYWAVLQGVLPHARALWIAPKVEAALAAHWPEGRPVDAGFGAVTFHEPSLMFLAGTDTQFLPTGNAGADFLAGGPDRVVAVGRRDLPGFDAEAARIGLAAAPFATVDGVNYSNGRRVALTLFARGRLVGARR